MTWHLSDYGDSRDLSNCVFLLVLLIFDLPLAQNKFYKDSRDYSTVMSMQIDGFWILKGKILHYLIKGKQIFLSCFLFGTLSLLILQLDTYQTVQIAMLHIDCIACIACIACIDCIDCIACIICISCLICITCSNCSNCCHVSFIAMDVIFCDFWNDGYKRMDGLTN